MRLLWNSIKCFLQFDTLITFEVFILQLRRVILQFLLAWRLIWFIFLRILALRLHDLLFEFCNLIIHSLMLFRHEVTDLLNLLEVIFAELENILDLQRLYYSILFFHKASTLCAIEAGAHRVINASCIAVSDKGVGHLWYSRDPCKCRLWPRLAWINHILINVFEYLLFTIICLWDEGVFFQTWLNSFIL